MASTKPVLVHHEAFNDLDHASTLQEVASKCSTKIGMGCIKDILCAPIYCEETLRARAKDVTSLIGRSMDLRKRLAIVAVDEEDAQWCTLGEADHDDDTAELLKEPYFRGFAKTLNRAWPALWANNAYSMFVAPAMALVAPLSYLVAPYFIIRFKLKLPLDFKTFVQLMYHSFKGAGAAMKLVFGQAPSFAMQLASVAMTCVVYFQSVIATFRHSFKLVGVCQRVAMRMNSLSRVLDMCDELIDGVFDSSFFKRWDTCDFVQVPNTGPRPRPLDHVIRPWKTGFARALHDFDKLDKNWVRFRLRQLSLIDAVCAVCAATKEHRLRPVYFLPGGTDALLISSGRRLKADDRTNSLAMMRGVNGIILTGANASGKSTVLRMIGCVVLLAQTTGLAPGACALTPMKYLTTMMSIRDDPDAGRSRFQNELQRAGECVESARTRPNDIGLLLLDEIFGGTDPVQGDVCGSKVLSSLADTTGCLYVLATHQQGLVRHSLTLPSARQFRMEPDYKLAMGVNSSFNATQLFEQAMN